MCAINKMMSVCLTIASCFAHNRGEAKKQNVNYAELQPSELLCGFAVTYFGTIGDFLFGRAVAYGNVASSKIDQWLRPMVCKCQSECIYEYERICAFEP